MDGAKCERCGRSINWTMDLSHCSGCGRIVCWFCVPSVQDLYKPPSRGKKGHEAKTRPAPCWDCLAARIAESGCEACAAYHPGKTPCDQCPLPLSSRDIGSERHLRLVYQAVANHHHEVPPPLSELWHVFAQRTWEKSQRGRGFNPTDDRPDVRAVRLPVDEVAARLTTLGLAFRYDVTQCNPAILAELKKTSPILNVCNACGAVARSGSTYGWCWGPEGTFCPYHRDVELPPRPGNWLDLVNAPAEGTEARDHQAEAFRREAPSEESGPADPEAATQAETANLRPLPPRWAEEDVRFLLARLDTGPILVSDPALGIPTIHDPLLKNARHLGFGVFEAETPEYTVGFEAGGALQRTPSGQGWCYLTIKQGCFPYDTEAVRRTLRTWLGEEPAIPRVLEGTSSRALALLYRDWLSVTNGDESAYPSEQRLAQYQAWAEELVVGGAREKAGSDFRRFCRVRLEGQARGLDLDAAARAYRNRCDFPPPSGWDCLRETDEWFYNCSWETSQGGLRESDRCVRCGRPPRPGETGKGWVRRCGAPVVLCPECHDALLAWKDAQIEEHRREAKESARQTRKARQAEASAAGPKRRNLPPDVPDHIEVDLGRSEGWHPAAAIAVRGKNLLYRLSDGREGRVPLIGRDILWRAQVTGR